MPRPDALRRFPSVLDPHADLLNVGVDELKGNSLLCIQREDGVLVEVLENVIGERNGHDVINPLQRMNLQLPGVLQGQTVEARSAARSALRAGSAERGAC
jgi:hypothetical protein